ncbi:hypothetical protein [Nannocystis sp. SCPEA4]|uniref:hypothetical protein n=1 Tax=Nannocystis sp. SCPEA4 TaxID=2996787 RepID=UPI0022701ACF|nr:hypothetical protein [Nannocystis sp. SCPEA4]MCY1062914.1 hypothetical protein [Nannocystis sp. SCPEA4]
MRLSLVLLAAVACVPRPPAPQPAPASEGNVQKDMPEKTGPIDQVPAAAPPARLAALTPGPGVRVALDVRGQAAVALPSTRALGPTAVLAYEHRGADEPLRIALLRTD